MATPKEILGPLGAVTGEVTAGAPRRIQPQQTPDTPPRWQPTLSADEPAGSPEEVRAPDEEPFAQAEAEQGSLAGTQAPAIAAATRRPVRARTSSATVLLAISALIALGGIGFAVGRATSTGQTGTGASNGAADGNAGFGQLGPNASGVPGDFGGRALGGGQGASTVTGTVVSVSAGSITLQLADGQTVQIATGSSTTYHSQTSATGTDVATGDTVIVQTTTGAAAGSSPGTNAGASASPAANTGTRTATDVTITAK